MAQPRSRTPIPGITGGILLAFGLFLAVGGIWLITLGGSWYYALAAVGFLLCGALLITRSPAALWVYAAVMLGSLAWTLYEVGFDWWQFAPRLDVTVILGLWLLTPWVVRGISDGTDTRPPQPARAPRLGLAASVLLTVLAGIAALIIPPDGPDGTLPTEVVVNLPPDRGRVPAADWHHYGRTQYGDRYSPLDQITPENVNRLQMAWHYQTGDLRRPDDPDETTYEVTPVKVDDTVYLCTPHNYVIALDAGTGDEHWRYDPEVPDNANRQHLTCRGVSYHLRPDVPEGEVCRQRIFMPTADARLIALDAETGLICSGFGENGQINLWFGMPELDPGFYYSTSPPAVTENLIIVGGAVNDNVSTTDPSGVIRAYDVNTGELVWNWDARNPEQTQPIAPGETYSHNSPNSWSIMSVDEELGLVYAPMANASPDQWGGNRGPNVERFSASVTALSLETGQVEWVFQTVHHDLWDMDVPSQPSLVDLNIGGETVPALVQPTKQGEIFVLDRRSGEPILPVEEVPAPQGAAEGDHTAPTQPVSQLSFNPPSLRGRDMWGVTLFDQLMCRVSFHLYDYRGRYTPPSTNGALVHPGNFGAFNWGGVAVDPERQVMFATPAYLAFISTLIPRDDPNTYLVSEGPPGLNENFGTPFAVKLEPFLSPLGLPCQAPPWGYVAGANLRTGEVAWQHRNGTVRDLAPLPLPFEMGVPDLGGPVMTAGGVAFISGTLDYYVRAYDVTTGDLLWQDRLPAGGQATPMSYAHGGRQYLLVVAGGHGSLGTRAGDHVIAYTLADDSAGQ